MKVADVIQKLEALMLEHGNVEVVTYDENESEFLLVTDVYQDEQGDSNWGYSHMEDIGPYIFIDGAYPYQKYSEHTNEELEQLAQGWPIKREESDASF